MTAGRSRPEKTAAPQREADQGTIHHVNRATRLASTIGNASVTGLLRSPRSQGSGGTRAAGLDDSVARAVQQRRGHGTSLHGAIRTQMEDALGHSLGDVRVHADDKAHILAQHVAARAFTVGRDVFFSHGTYQPASREGRRLLAHELTHVAQQAGASAQPPAAVSHPRDPSEREADAVAEQVLTGGSPTAGNPTVDAGTHTVQQRDGTALQRQEDSAATAAREAVFDAVDSTERALEDTVSRYRSWLTHNLVRLLSDIMASDRGVEVLAENTSFAVDYGKTLIGDAIGFAGVAAGAHSGGRQLARLFLELRHARVVGGFVGFLLAAVLETVVAGLFDRSTQIRDATAEAVSEFVTQVVNPIADDRQEELTTGIQELRRALRTGTFSVTEWGQMRSALVDAEAQARQAFTDTGDERLYRQLALLTGVYRGRDVAAERRSPVTLSGAGRPFTFRMQHSVVDTGATTISVPSDGSVVVVRARAHDCISYDGEYGPVEARGREAAPSWQQTPPPTTFSLRLYEPGWVFDDELSVPRVFHVGEVGYGIWYGVPSGSYRIRVWRSGYHPVAVCGECAYWVRASAS